MEILAPGPRPFSSFQTAFLSSEFALDLTSIMESLPIERTIPEAGSPRPFSIKNGAIQALKLAMATSVVLVLVFRGDIGWEALQASLSKWQYSIPAFLLLALTPVGHLWRWQSLLRASSVVLPHREVFSYLMISKFFNMAFPSYLSGDIIRGFYVLRRAAKRNTGVTGSVEGDDKAGSSTVVTSILLDRLAGLLPLLLFCLLGLLGSLWYALPPRVVASVGAVAGSGVLLLLFLFLMAYRLPQPPDFLLKISKRFNVHHLVSSLFRGTHHYVRNLKLIRNILGISFLNHGLAIAGFVLFGLALGIDVPLMGYLIFVPLGLMVTALPVAPAGLGVGQVAFLALFHTLGTSQGANLFTLFMASHILINLSGAALYLLSQVHVPLSQQAIPAEAEAGKQ